MAVCNCRGWRLSVAERPDRDHVRRRLRHSAGEPPDQLLAERHPVRIPRAGPRIRARRPHQRSRPQSIRRQLERRRAADAGLLSALLVRSLRSDGRRHRLQGPHRHLRTQSISINQSISRSIVDQSINRSINQSINQSVDQSSINRSIDQSISQSKHI